MLSADMVWSVAVRRPNAKIFRSLKNPTIDPNIVIQSVMESNNEDYSESKLYENVQINLISEYIECEKESNENTREQSEESDIMNGETSDISQTNVGRDIVERIDSMNDDKYNKEITMNNKELIELISAAETLEEYMEKNGFIKDRSYNLRNYKQCFVGREMMEKIVMLKLAENEKEALKFGNSLIETNIIQHVTKDHTFKNGYFFYKFVAGYGAIKTLNEKIVQLKEQLEAKTAEIESEKRKTEEMRMEHKEQINRYKLMEEKYASIQSTLEQEQRRSDVLLELNNALKQNVMTILSEKEELEENIDEMLAKYMEQMEEIKNSQRAKENEYEYKMIELKEFLAQKKREIADKKQNLLIEIEERNEKYKEIESELKRVNVEKDEILKEKKSIKKKFADYVKLQYQFRANELKINELKTKDLNQPNLEQNDQINSLTSSIIAGWNTLKTLTLINPITHFTDH